MIHACDSISSVWSRVCSTIQFVLLFCTQVYYPQSTQKGGGDNFVLDPPKRKYKKKGAISQRGKETKDNEGLLRMNVLYAHTS